MSGNSEAIIKIRSGKIEGIIENEMFAFKGVPHAAPPVELISNVLISAS